MPKHKRSLSFEAYTTLFLKKFNSYSIGLFGKRTDVTERELEKAMFHVAEGLRKRHHIEEILSYNYRGRMIKTIMEAIGHGDYYKHNEDVSGEDN